MPNTPKIQRWIDLIVALLRRHFPVPLEELSGDVPAYDTGQKPEALRRMFERDKEELRGFGIAIETVMSPEHEIVGYRLQPKFFYLPYLHARGERAATGRRVDRYGYRALENLTFEPEELAAVADGAARIRQLGDPLLAEHADSAMRKLACDLPVDAAGGDAPRIVPPRSKARAELLATLGEALERRKHVTFDYRGMGSDAVGGRTVEPFGLFFLNGSWYLAARAPGEETVKNYRLNRVGTVSVNEKRPGSPDYVIPAAFDLRDHAHSRQAWELGAGDAVTAIVQFGAMRGASSAAFRLGEEVEGQPRQRRFRVRRTDVFSRWLLSFAGDLVPVAPRELVKEYRELVRATREHHAH